MGFLERSRSLRRKDSALPLQKQDQSFASRRATKGAIATPAVPTEDPPRPSTSKTTSSSQNSQKDVARPRTTGRQQPPMPDYQSFKFPTPVDSPRGSMSHSRNLTLHNNSSVSGLSSDQSIKPEYKRSMTTPMTAVPQASVHKGTVQLSTKELPKIDAAVEPVAPEKKRPTLHKSRSSTWKSFFQRKQSRPPVPDFDPAELRQQQQPPPLPKKSATADRKTVAVAALPALPDPPNVNAHERNQSRNMARQVMRAEMDKAQFEKSSSPKSKPESGGRDSPQQNRPQMTQRSVTCSSIASEHYFDAVSRMSTNSPQPPSNGGHHGKGPRLEVSIPDVELERYSVMFEKLLKPKQSLMERRRTMVQGLNIPQEQPSAAGGLSPSLTPGGRPQPQRRATSPNMLCPSPMTAELVESSSQIATPVAIRRVSMVPVNGPRMLRRSRTAPPGALSPGRAQYEENQRPAPPQQQQRQQQQPQSAIDNTSSATSTRHSPIWSEASLPATPATTSETGSFMSLDDYDDDDNDQEEAEIITYDTKSLMPTVREPAWDMISPATSDSASTPKPLPVPMPSSARTTTGVMPPPIPPKAPGRAVSRETSRERRDVHPPRTSSLESLPPSDKHKSTGQLPISHPHPLQMNAVTHRPVQISIARQVSVRRPSGAGGGPRTAPLSSSSKAATPTVAEPSPMFSKQPLRPKVVEVRNRKSTMVVLESASAATSSESLASR